MTRASRSRELRSALPLGTDLVGAGPATDDVEAVRAALLEALAQVDASDLVAGLAGAARAAQRPAPLAPLAQAEAATALDERRGWPCGPTSRPPWCRPRVVARCCAAGWARSPSSAPTLRRSSSSWPTAPPTAGELGLELARTLLRTGVVVPA